MNEPILLKSVGKDYLWGGTRLNDDFNLDIPCVPLAEAWVCSAHRNGPSFVPALDCTLAEAIEKHPEWLGTHAVTLADAKLPILIKLIDAKQNLSVQVHPNDEQAALEGDLGKTEMWYVVDANRDAQLICGFNREVADGTVKDAAISGEIESLLNRVQVHANDVFFIEPGTVHSIGAGVLIAEIQESSDLTYRLYDYGRTDKNGRRRELHLDKALGVINYKAGSNLRQPMRILRYEPGYASEFIARCKYFQVSRIVLNTEVRRALARFQTTSTSFHALLCIEGCGSISWGGGAVNFFKGDCFFVPADSVQMLLHGKAQLLDVSC